MTLLPALALRKDPVVKLPPRLEPMRLNAPMNLRRCRF